MVTGGRRAGPPQDPQQNRKSCGKEDVEMRLEKKVALITGGYGGMGRASARLFAKEGAVVFVAGRDRERGEALAQEIDGAGGKAHFVELDVTHQDQWDAAVARIRERAGGRTS